MTTAAMMTSSSSIAASVAQPASVGPPTNKSLFFKECAIKTLEIREDYETWVSDIREYFNVSGYPELSTALASGKHIPLEFDRLPWESKIDMQQRNVTVLLQGRYVIYRCIGITIKKEISKAKYKTETLEQLWIAIRNCFYLEDEAAIQQIRDDIAAWDVEKAGTWSEWVAGIVKLYSRLDIVAKERTFHPSDKLFKLRNILSKLDGENERAIRGQVEIMVDQNIATKTPPADLYDVLQLCGSKNENTRETGTFEASCHECGSESLRLF